MRAKACSVTIARTKKRQRYPVDGYRLKTPPCYYAAAARCGTAGLGSRLFPVTTRENGRVTVDYLPLPDPHTGAVRSVQHHCRDVIVIWGVGNEGDMDYLFSAADIGCRILRWLPQLAVALLPRRKLCPLALTCQLLVVVPIAPGPQVAKPTCNYQAQLAVLPAI